MSTPPRRTFLEDLQAEAEHRATMAGADAARSRQQLAATREARTARRARQRAAAAARRRAGAPATPAGGGSSLRAAAGEWARTVASTAAIGAATRAVRAATALRPDTAPLLDAAPTTPPAVPLARLAREALAAALDPTLQRRLDTAEREATAVRRDARQVYVDLVSACGGPGMAATSLDLVRALRLRAEQWQRDAESSLRRDHAVRAHLLRALGYPADDTATVAAATPTEVLAATVAAEHDRAHHAAETAATQRDAATTAEAAVSRTLYLGGDLADVAPADLRRTLVELALALADVEADADVPRDATLAARVRNLGRARDRAQQDTITHSAEAERRGTRIAQLAGQLAAFHRALGVPVVESTAVALQVAEQAAAALATVPTLAAADEPADTTVRRAGVPAERVGLDIAAVVPAARNPRFGTPR